jgi:hypothetical protein
LYALILAHCIIIEIIAPWAAIPRSHHVLT